MGSLKFKLSVLWLRIEIELIVFFYLFSISIDFCLLSIIHHFLFNNFFWGLCWKLTVLNWRHKIFYCLYVDLLYFKISVFIIISFIILKFFKQRIRYWRLLWKSGVRTLKPQTFFFFLFEAQTLIHFKQWLPKDFNNEYNLYMWPSLHRKK